MTVLEFQRLVDRSGGKLELIDGRLSTAQEQQLSHEIAKSNLVALLAIWLHANPIAKLFVGTEYQVDRHNALTPDVSLLYPGRIAPGQDLILGAPELAIEIVSSESVDIVQSRSDLYFANGTKSVWMIFPTLRTVLVSGWNRGMRFDIDDTLEDPVALPGFQTSVASLFEGI